MTAAFREFIFDSAPRVFTHLFNGKTHLAAVLVECYDLRFMLVVQFKELFRVDRRVRPGDLTYVNQAFDTRKYLKESTIIFNVHYFTFHHGTFPDVLR